MKTAAIKHSVPSSHEIRSGGRIVFSLLMRTLLFFVFGIGFVGLFALVGHADPLKAAERWWPFQAIFANAATFLILRYWIHKEGSTYRSMFKVRKGELGKLARQFCLLLIVGFALGGIPLFAFSYLLLGTVVPPDTMFQSLPVWAAIIALVVFPLSNGLVETPTYIGYALPRLYKKTGILWVAVMMTGLALAFQHIVLPMVFDVPYMLWRFLSFIPLAIALGFIFSRTKKLLPIALAHYVMDLQLGAQVFLVSLG
ncbi:CPBP family intramembrane metalloprotease [Paenibacillus mesophilus]|uniref:CPBP family glutamic-type intramembrane protease n=1 Tax=Paenibacillus mesophilus TaxID=2582849 RepID=UPI00110E9C11|nr:CPBP family glutamic-type intramembrane protease [Paenibacillus mesophilus]TMV46241.1 CPBP family intramembrane metalloprotease [Paenibacillus mesophilus]